MLFSRMVARRINGSFEKTRNSVIDRTATGMDADTVRPTFNTKYIEDAPKRIPSNAPTTSEGHVNSGIVTLSGTNGLCSGSGGAPTFGSDSAAIGASPLRQIEAGRRTPRDDRMCAFYRRFGAPPSGGTRSLFLRRIWREVALELLQLR